MLKSMVNKPFCRGFQVFSEEGGGEKTPARTNGDKCPLIRFNCLFWDELGA